VVRGELPGTYPAFAPRTVATVAAVGRVGGGAFAFARVGSGEGGDAGNSHRKGGTKFAGMSPSSQPTLYSQELPGALSESVPIVRWERSHRLGRTVVAVAAVGRVGRGEGENAGEET
jgi:hypothetical protein